MPVLMFKAGMLRDANGEGYTEMPDVSG